MMDTILGILKEITVAGFSIWLFFSFGLPLIISIIALFIYGFSEGGFLSWKGRMNRVSYLVNNIAVIVVASAAAYISGFAFAGQYVILAMGGFVIAVLAAFRGFAMTARRLHDLNLPGVIVIALFVFEILFDNYEFAMLCSSFIWILILIWPGKKCDNQYGEVPKSGISY